MRSAGRRPPEISEPIQATGCQRLGGSPSARSRATARSRTATRASGDRRRWAAARATDVVAGSRATARAGGIGPLPARHRRASDAWTRRPWSRRARGPWARGSPRPRRVRRALADEPQVGRRPPPGCVGGGSPDTVRTPEARRCAPRPDRPARAAIRRPRPPPVLRRRVRRSPLPSRLRLPFLPALSTSPAPLRRRARARRLLEARGRPLHVAVAAPARASARPRRGEIRSGRAAGPPGARWRVDVPVGKEASWSSGAEAVAPTRPLSRGPRRPRWRLRSGRRRAARVGGDSWPGAGWRRARPRGAPPSPRGQAADANGSRIPLQPAPDTRLQRGAGRPRHAPPELAHGAAEANPRAAPRGGDHDGITRRAAHRTAPGVVDVVIL